MKQRIRRIWLALCTIDMVKELCAGKLLIAATHSEDDAELLGAKIIHL